VEDPVRYYRAFRLDRDREAAVLQRLLERSAVRNALPVRLLASGATQVGLSRLSGRLRAELAPAFTDRGLALKEVSGIEFQPPRQAQAAFIQKQKVASAALREEQEAGRYADMVRATVEARRATLVTEAEREAGEITERAKLDVARAAELASLVTADPSARERLIRDAFRDVLRRATCHPILSRRGTREFRVRLRRVPAKKPEEDEQQ
jgi:hypothetical protein